MHGQAKGINSECTRRVALAHLTDVGCWHDNKRNGERGSTEVGIASAAIHGQSIELVALKRAVWFLARRSLLADDDGAAGLASESVQGAALALEGVDDVHCRDGLALGVLRVGDGVADNVLQEHLENTASFLVDETGDALDTSTARETTDGRLGDALDVVAQHLTMTLGAALSEPLTALASARHICAAWSRFEVGTTNSPRKRRPRYTYSSGGRE